MAKEYGNRRSDEDLKKITEELNALTYQLEEQPDFNGTDKELEMMQAFERYYIDGYPKLSDEEWEALKYRYNYKESLVSIAPSGREWIKMQAPLPSIEKGSSVADLKEFLNRWPEKTEFLVEPKCDGLTANIVYQLDADAGVYRHQYTTSRGNGRYGLKLWPHALNGVNMHGVPETITAEQMSKALKVDVKNLPEIFELRGEAMLQKNEANLIKYAANTIDGWESVNLLDVKTGFEMVVWRSVISGIFNRKVPNNIKGILCYLYEGGFEENFVEQEVPFVGVAKAFLIDSIANARLLHSISNDEERFLRGDKLWVLDDLKTVIALHKNGNVFKFEDQGEDVYVISYSFAHSGNAGFNEDDINVLKSIDGVLCLEDIHTMNGEPTPFAFASSDHEEIIRALCDFYGCDDEGKRLPGKDRMRNRHEFSLDGIVVKLKNSNPEEQGLAIRNALAGGNRLVIPKYPKDQIAIKLPAERVTVKLEKIERNETDLKNVTLRGILDRPYRTESGAIVENINLHNPNWLELNPWIKEGGVYDVVMAMDIIPQLLPPSVSDET